MVYKAYLSHHGIKGQKWGVQNGPPYPLNDTVKAIAFRGGRKSDGTYIENLTDRDVRKARRLVDKHINTMSEDEIREYKERLMMEKDMGYFIHPKSTRLKENLADAATDAVTSSVRNAGTKILTNIEVNAIGNIVGKVFGENVAAMITDGVTQYQIKQNERKKETEDREYNLRKEQQDNLKTQSDRNYDLQKEQQERQKIQDERAYDQDKRNFNYNVYRDNIRDEQQDYQNETQRKKVENETYKNETDRQKADTDAYRAETERTREQNLHDEAERGLKRSSGGDNKNQNQNGDGKKSNKKKEDKK